jgi:pimeloyl-ACP methyl ester carboxylesterase
MSHPANAISQTVPTRVGPLNVSTIGSGPPAVLWHSLFVDSTTFTRVCTPLAEVRRLILVDGPNHGGQSPVRSPFTLDDCAEAALDILDMLDVTEPVDWLGNAWGGHAGVLFAAGHPDRCRTLTAIGAPINAPTNNERRRTRLLSCLYQLAGPELVSAPVVDALLGPEARTNDPAGAAIVAEAFGRANRRGMYDAVRWLSLARRDLTDVLDRLKTPTLLTTGHHDPMWTTQAARSAASHLHNGALVILPGSGHVGPLLQAPDAVAELVTTFWREPDHTITRHLEPADPQRPGIPT